MLLEQNGEILYNEDLDKALEAFHSQAEDSCIPYLESIEEVLSDESKYIKDQLNVKTKLLSTVKYVFHFFRFTPLIFRPTCLTLIG